MFFQDWQTEFKQITKNMKKHAPTSPGSGKISQNQQIRLGLSADPPTQVAEFTAEVQFFFLISVIFVACSSG